MTTTSETTSAGEAAVQEFARRVMDATIRLLPAGVKAALRARGEQGVEIARVVIRDGVVDFMQSDEYAAERDCLLRGSLSSTFCLSRLCLDLGSKIGARVAQGGAK